MHPILVVIKLRVVIIVVVFNSLGIKFYKLVYDILRPGLFKLDLLFYDLHGEVRWKQRPGLPI
jgi:hypothetical protein